MHISLIYEYNHNGHLLYFGNLPGGYVRGRTLSEAVDKIVAEDASYCAWAGIPYDGRVTYEIVQEKVSDLQICDADSDVLFDSEKEPLTMDEYKRLALKSASDFLQLYEAIPDHTGTVLAPRKTFYGQVPATAAEMYAHTKNVNEYYFGELNVDASNEPDILVCRRMGFEALEKTDGFLRNAVIDGSYGEQWTLRKMLRCFIWHDRIHVKAMWRMAKKLCGCDVNPFAFEEASQS